MPLQNYYNRFKLHSMGWDTSNAGMNWQLMLRNKFKLCFQRLGWECSAENTYFKAGFFLQTHCRSAPYDQTAHIDILTDSWDCRAAAAFVPSPGYFVPGGTWVSGVGPAPAESHQGICCGCQAWVREVADCGGGQASLSTPSKIDVPEAPGTAKLPRSHCTRRWGLFYPSLRGRPSTTAFICPTEKTRQTYRTPPGC